MDQDNFVFTYLTPLLYFDFLVIFKSVTIFSTLPINFFSTCLLKLEFGDSITFYSFFEKTGLIFNWKKHKDISKVCVFIVIAVSNLILTKLLQCQTTSWNHIMESTLLPLAHWKGCGLYYTPLFQKIVVFKFLIFYLF